METQIEKCQYKGCNKNADIGFYCWEHNPYMGMTDPKEQKKLENYYKNPLETIKRSSVKSFLWRIIGVIILASVTYFYTRKWIQTTWITFLHHGIFFFVFIAHERFWLKVDIQGLKRKIMKCITYETILGNFILAIISLIITGNVQTMTKITLTYIGIKHLCYIFNEFIWDRIKFGRR